MKPPDTLQIGDTWAWTATVEDYPAPTWTLKFSLHKYGADPILITAAQDGSGTGYSVTVIAETTKTYAPGKYAWKAVVEQGTGAARERYTVGEGYLELLPDLFEAISTTDTRTHARRMLDAIEAALEAAGSDAAIVALTINGRSVQYKRDVLTRMRNDYRREVARERGDTGTIYEQFGSGR